MILMIDTHCPWVWKVVVVKALSFTDLQDSLESWASVLDNNIRIRYENTTLFFS